MKKNFPVTGVENNYDPSIQLISTTDKKGIITLANQGFIDVCGFSEDELVGKNHNIVRHPDMPPAGFADLWDTLKAGRPWMGIVKNRCKNGDHYWVDAYVTAMYEGNEVSGYQSVRVAPNRAHVARAEQLYRLINNGKSLKGKLLCVSLRTKLFVTLVSVVGLTLLFSVLAGGIPWLYGLLGFGVGGGASYAFSHYVTRTLRKAACDSRAIIDNAIARWVYTGRNDEIGQLQVANLMMQAKLRTVIGRLEDSAGSLAAVAEQAAATAEQTRQGVARQQAETDQVATAVNEMSATVQEVASNTVEAASAAATSNDEAAQGKRVVVHTMDSIDALNSEVQRAAEVIQNLAAESETISQVLDAISGITEQTNLLALNAAIEAARAGEAGRGFAVVADEVRTLASRTQDATAEIKAMIEKLQSGVGQAVQAMDKGRSEVEAGVAKAAEAGTALDKITEAVNRISDMNTQIASAAEEQSAVAEEVNKNLVRISTLADETAAGADHSAQASVELARVAGELNLLVAQFKQI